MVITLNIPATCGDGNFDTVLKSHTKQSLALAKVKSSNLIGNGVRKEGYYT